MADLAHEPKATVKELPRVVIIGGGFGGLEAVKTLKKAKVRVTIIDRRNHHLFQPLLYQVATASLNPANIAGPIRHIFRNVDNLEVLLGEVSDIDVANKVVKLTDGEVQFDYLIVAAGASHSYMGHDDWAEHAPGLKSLEDAVEIRRRILLAYEAAEREHDPRARREWLTFVVVGGGPTGSELAGSLTEIARNDMVHEFRNFNPTRTRVVLVEAGPKVMAAYPDDLRDSAKKQLESLGVEVKTNFKVTHLDETGVHSDTEFIPARTILWGAGVQGSALGKKLGVPLDKNGRVEVQPDLTIPGHSNIYVIGDQSSLKMKDGKPVPGVAQGAIQGGRHAAKNILRDLKGLPHTDFAYFDKGEFATIGRAKGIGYLKIGSKKIHCTNFFAWMMWSLIHVFFLVGFRNRFLVMFEWVLLYVFHDRGSRLITGNFQDIMHEVHTEQPADKPMQPKNAGALV